ncbi:unnamed protein product [Calypogeia fissa]
MPRPQGRRSGKTMAPANGRAKSGTKAKRVVEENDDDLELGLGRAHDEDFLALEEKSSGGEEDSDDEDQNPVFNLKDSDDDEDSDDLDEEQLTGLEAKLIKQAKIMKQKAGLDEEEEDEDDEEDDKEPAAWGKSKKLYYSADNVDFEIQSDDEEAPAEEEAEVLRLQRKAAASLRPEDYEQDDDEESDDGEDTLEKVVERKEDKSSKLAAKDSKIMAVEEVKKDISALSKEEKMGVVMSDAPELVGLLSELREGLDELRNKVQPLVEKVKEGQYATKEGISYLEVKHLLLLNYCQSIIFYLLLKAEGRSVRDHPVIARLVELRLFLEKIRPIDKKLQYQIDKLLKTANAPSAESREQKEDALKYRPNPDLLVSKLDEDTEATGGVYRPPMIAPVAMEEDIRPKDKRNKERAEKESRRRASRSAYMKDIANELEGKPEEVQEIIGTESKEMMREKARLDARAKEEEELFSRVPLSRVERKKLKQLKQSKSGLMDLLDDFDDGLADLVGMDEDRYREPARGPPSDLLKPRKLSQVIAESGRASKKAKVMSGDADLPVKEDLGERRRKHEMQSVRSFDDNMGSDEDDHDKSEPVEDDFYKEAKQLAEAKKAAKRAKYEREPILPSVEEDEEGKRHITNMMEKNRGLTPHRKKLTKNPRKKYKLKHDKAVIRRKGQVRAVKAGGGSYGGETTGIRTNLSRSVRIQN